MLQDDIQSSLLHFDIDADERIFTQNLQGIRNNSIRTREKLQQKEKDILYNRKVILNY